MEPEVKWDVPTRPVTAGELLRQLDRYGPTLAVMIQVDQKRWRKHASQEAIRKELASLPAKTPAVLRLEHGEDFQCFGTRLDVFGAVGDALYEPVEAGEYASIAIFGHRHR